MPQRKSVNPRKVAQQSRSKKKVEKILQVAAHILETEGLEGFNTNAIAEAAEISIGSLYQYFPDKDAIAATLIRQKTSRFLSRLESAIESDTAQETKKQAFQTRVQQLISIAVDQQLARPQLARVLDMEESRLPLDEETQAAQRRIINVIAQLLEQAGYEDIGVVTQDILAIARGMIDTAGALGESDAKRLEKRVARAVFGYLNSDR